MVETVGIPRALLFHYYATQWLEFFKFLGVKTIVSPPSNREIVRRGIALSVDEACYSSKVYLGHVDWLSTRCDMVFMLRNENSGIREDFCPRIFAMYDIVKHTFPRMNLLHADVNYIFRKREVDAFIKIATDLGKTVEEGTRAYEHSVAMMTEEISRKNKEQEEKLQREGLKVMIVAHAYNTHDAVIGGDILDYFDKNNVTVIHAGCVDKACAKQKTMEKYGKRVYWKVNSDLMGGIEILKERVDGIVLLTTFPCGPDSIFNEMVIRSIKDVPVLSLMMDELDATAGLQTRLESFIDILQARSL